MVQVHGTAHIAGTINRSDVTIATFVIDVCLIWITTAHGLETASASITKSCSWCCCSIQSQHY